MSKCSDVVIQLKKLSRPENLAGMARFGIDTSKALAISIPTLRKMARKYKKQHELALALWQTGIHEARVLATMIDDPAAVTDKQMESWVSDFYSWDLCDQCCSNLFDKTPFARRKAFEWSKRTEEYVKRAGFTLMATLSVHDKESSDKVFIRFLKPIKREANDGRNFVKKAVNWALRQIGKRNTSLKEHAIRTAEEIRKLNTPSARWIASDALREFQNHKFRRA
ncbi:MAG: DNA alkylation repair protein [Lentisphaerae bacterium RIFOXYA12_FULL_48_11]|nr:MAG: DNA alkylation repair protein [Lentisphaerae bacterium RIFOXYA12_FULL_48_11]